MQLQVQQSPEGQEGSCPMKWSAGSSSPRRDTGGTHCCLWAVIHVQLCPWPANRGAQCKLPWTWLEWTGGAEHLPPALCPVAESLEQAHPCVPALPYLPEGLLLLPGHRAQPCLLPGQQLCLLPAQCWAFSWLHSAKPLRCVGREIGAGQEGMSFCRWKHRRRILPRCCVLISFFEPAERW